MHTERQKNPIAKFLMKLHITELGRIIRITIER